MNFAHVYYMKKNHDVVLCLQFEIVPEDDPQNAIVGLSALSCHTDLLKAIAAKT